MANGGHLKIYGLLLITAACSFAQSAVPLGTAANFAILAATTVSNTGSSVIKGSVGVSPGSAIIGFPPGVVSPGSIEANDPAAQNAQADLTTAYNNAAGQAQTQNLTGQDLGGKTLGPGVYFFATSAQLTGTLTLNGGGNSNAIFVFQIGTTLTTAGASIVATTNGAQAANIFWQVGSSATLGTSSVFIGNILALTSITTTTSALMAGRLLARNGAVTTDTIALTFPPAIPPGGFGGPPAGPSPTPAPSSLILVLTALACAGLFQARFRIFNLIRRN